MKKIADLEGEDIASFSASCGSCGADISWKETGKRTGKRTWKRRRIVHINICQDPSIIYFCNRDCKLNWIFKRPEVKPEKAIKSDLVKEDVKSTLDVGKIEDNTEELDEYLKENHVKIVRRA
jgi:hypothetical protein